MDNKKIDIFYDGSCPMCSVFADTVADSSKGQAFANQDITKGKLPEGATFQQVWREMYVIEDGKQYKGADAIFRVLAQYPRWRWFAAFGMLPVINPIAHLVYRIVAANRHRIPWRKKTVR